MGVMSHGLGVVAAVAVGKGTPGSKSSHEEIQKTRSEAMVSHEGLCQPSLGVQTFPCGW